MAETYNHKLDIISCWDYELEAALRNSALLNISENDIDQEIQKAKDIYYTKVLDLMQDADIKSEYTIHHIRGNPATHRPHFVDEHNIDILANLPCDVLVVRDRR